MLRPGNHWLPKQSSTTLREPRNTRMQRGRSFITRHDNILIFKEQYPARTIRHFQRCLEFAQIHQITSGPSKSMERKTPY
jgi:hypothetical protein